MATVQDFWDHILRRLRRQPDPADTRRLARRFARGRAWEDMQGFSWREADGSEHLVSHMLRDGWLNVVSGDVDAGDFICQSISHDGILERYLAPGAQVLPRRLELAAALEKEALTVPAAISRAKRQLSEAEGWQKSEEGLRRAVRAAAGAGHTELPGEVHEELRTAERHRRLQDGEHQYAEYLYGGLGRRRVTSYLDRLAEDYADENPSRSSSTFSDLAEARRSLADLKAKTASAAQNCQSARETNLVEVQALRDEIAANKNVAQQEAMRARRAHAVRVDRQVAEIMNPANSRRMRRKGSLLAPSKMPRTAVAAAVERAGSTAGALDLLNNPMVMVMMLDMIADPTRYDECVIDLDPCLRVHDALTSEDGQSVSIEQARNAWSAMSAVEASTAAMSRTEGLSRSPSEGPSSDQSVHDDGDSWSGGSDNGSSSSYDSAPSSSMDL